MERVEAMKNHIIANMEHEAAQLHRSLMRNWGKYEHSYNLWIMQITGKQKQKTFFYSHSDVSLLSEDQYALYGHKSGRIPRNVAGQIYDPTR